MKKDITDLFVFVDDFVEGLEKEALLQIEKRKKLG